MKYKHISNVLATTKRTKGALLALMIVGLATLLFLACPEPDSDSSSSTGDGAVLLLLMVLAVILMAMMSFLLLLTLLNGRLPLGRTVALTYPHNKLRKGKQ